jgi:hypothetical protein
MRGQIARILGRRLWFEDEPTQKQDRETMFEKNKSKDRPNLYILTRKH